mmetsp:Transcript_24361/g.37728  ORF Transcript_24361/g.37728 Transcript_24361/m.37728 type:complete len:151 (-) Transcript_24361:1897-2349(-)
MLTPKAKFRRKRSSAWNLVSNGGLSEGVIDLSNSTFSMKRSSSFTLEGNQSPFDEESSRMVPGFQKRGSVISQVMDPPSRKISTFFKKNDWKEEDKSSSEGKESPLGESRSSFRSSRDDQLIKVPSRGVTFDFIDDTVSMLHPAGASSVE